MPKARHVPRGRDSVGLGAPTGVRCPGTRRGWAGCRFCPLTPLVPQLRTDSEKRSLAESGLSWYGEAEDKATKKLDYDSSSLKMEHGSSKWRREPSESCEEGSKGGELKKPVSLGTPGSLKKGKTPPVAVTSPITHTAQSTLKVAGEAGLGRG